MSTAYVSSTFILKVWAFPNGMMVISATSRTLMPSSRRTKDWPDEFFKVTSNAMLPSVSQPPRAQYEAVYSPKKRVLGSTEVSWGLKASGSPEAILIIDKLSGWWADFSAPTTDKNASALRLLNQTVLGVCRAIPPVRMAAKRSDSLSAKT